MSREVEGVDLVVAGGFSDLDRGLQVPGLIRLVNGLTLVVTPSNGMSVGRVVLHFSQDSEGNMKVVDVVAEQIPVDRSVVRDPEVEQLVNDLRQRYELVANQRIGRVVGKTYRDQGRVVAGVMRRYLDSEVGIINRGGLGLVPSNRVLKVGHIDRLIPFDDRLVKMRLTGAQLLSIARRSQNALGEDAQLIFSGLGKNTINGRPIQKNELYRVVVCRVFGEWRRWIWRVSQGNRCCVYGYAAPTNGRLCTARYTDCAGASRVCHSEIKWNLARELDCQGCV